jgi:chromosome partitioning protein
MITAFINEDGGAGKTTIPSSIATIISEQQKVLLIDLTPKCSLTRLFTGDATYTPDATIYAVLNNNIDINSVITKTSYELIDIIPGHNSLIDCNEPLMQMLLREKLQALNEVYDHIFIDTANNGNLVDIAITASDQVFIIAKPSRDSLHGANKSFQLLQEINQRHGLNINLRQIILNRYNDSNTAIAIEGLIQSSPNFQNCFSSAYNIFETPSVNRLQYQFKNIGKEMGWVRSAKALQRIAQDFFA